MYPNIYVYYTILYDLVCPHLAAIGHRGYPRIAMGFLNAGELQHPLRLGRCGWVFTAAWFNRMVWAADDNTAMVVYLFVLKGDPFSGSKPSEVEGLSSIKFTDRVPTIIPYYWPMISHDRLSSTTIDH